MRAAVLALAALALIGAAVAWRWCGEDAAAAQPAQGPEGERSVTPELQWAAVDAGRSVRRGLVEDEAGLPLAGATVLLLDVQGVAAFSTCAVCDELAIECRDPSTSTLMRHAIHGAAPRVLAQRVADAEGRFSFDDAPDDAVVSATVAGRTGFALGGDETITVPDAVLAQVQVIDDLDEPLAGARLTWVHALDGSVTELFTDAEGGVVLENPSGSDWIVAEAPGLATVHARARHELVLRLGPPRVVSFETRLGGKPIDADVIFEGHGGRRTVRTVKGKARLEGLPREWTEFTASAGSWLSPALATSLVEPETTLVFELRHAASLTIALVDENGEPIERVSATVSSEEVIVSASAKNGAPLRFPQLAEGDYRLVIDGDGVVQVSRQIEVEGDMNLELELLRTKRLTGRVLTPDGRPAAGCELQLARNGVELLNANTSDDGTFELDVDSVGELELVATRQESGTASATVKVPGPPVELRLEARNALEATIVDAQGKPVPFDGVLVHAGDETNATTPVPRVAENTGRLTNLAAGDYRFAYDGQDFRHASTPVAIAEHGVTRVQLVVDHGAALEGRVLDLRGQPIDTATVFVLATLRSERCDAAGHFRVDGFEPGSEQQLVVEAQGFGTRTVDVTVPGEPLTVTLTPTARVTGRVLGAEGRPLPVFTVNDTEVRDAQGRFDVPTEEPQVLSVFAAGHQARVIDDAAPGEQGDVVLQPLTSLRGLVVDDQGQPVAAATVTASSVSTVTNAEGRFELMVDGLDEGEAATHLVARKGAREAETDAQAGHEARLVLRRGTRVHGRVLGPEGQGVRTTVNCSSIDHSEDHPTDAEGRFELELRTGVWTFGTRASSTKTTVALSGLEQVVELRAGGACGVEVSANGPIEFVVLSREPLSDEVDASGDGIAGTYVSQFQLPQPSRRVEGVPCGRWVVRAGTWSDFAQAEVTLSGRLQPVHLTFVPEEQESPPAE